MLKIGIAVLMLTGFTLLEASPMKTVHNTNRVVNKQELRCLEHEMEKLSYTESCRNLGSNSLICFYEESRYSGSETLTSRVSNEFEAAMNYCLK